MIYSLHLDHAVIAFANEQEMENFAFESLMVWQLAAGDTALLARQSNAGEKQTHLRVFIAAVMPDNDQLIVMEMADKGQLSVVSWKDLLLGPDDLSFRQMRNRLLTDEPKLRNGFRPRTAASENRSSIAPTTPLPSAFERTCNTPSAQRKRRKSGAAAAAALPSDCTVSTMAERKPAKSSTTTGNRSKRQRILEIGETALSEVNQSCLSPSVLAQQRLIRSRRVFEGYLFLLTSIGSNNGTHYNYL
jgi:hypothetical protein